MLESIKTDVTKVDTQIPIADPNNIFITATRLFICGVAPERYAVQISKSRRPLC